MPIVRNNYIRIITTILIFLLLILQFNITNVYASDTDQSILTPSDDQYFELRATNIKEVTGQNKQVIMELWGYNIEFKGLEVRFSYDGTKFTPSNIETNVTTTDETEYFKFEDEFSSSLELFDVGYTGDGDGFRWVTSFNPPVTESEHIVEKDGIGKVIVTTDGVLLGKMSFQMTADEFDISGFQLVGGSTTPTTGVKVNLDGTNSYQATSTFRFIDKTASKDATLSNIIISSGEVDELDPTNSTYKEHPLTPTFAKEKLNYEVELLEYIDTMKIKATTSDSKATMKLKVPKRDADNNLEYETDGTTIIYEEKDIQSDTPLEFTLNKLGEPDTIITVIVTAEDGKTINNYQITIKRPYGTIKGSIYLNPMKNTGIYKATVRLYETKDVNAIIDWSTVQDGKRDTIHDQLLTLNSIDKNTNDDGTYEIYVIPGTYDILLDREGYTDHIITSKTINEGDVLDLGQKELFAGDFNKDGVVQLLDLSMLYSSYDIDSTSSSYMTKLDVNDDGKIQLLDLAALKANYEKNRVIE